MNDPSRILEQHVDRIRGIVRIICRKSTLQAVDYEDLLSYTFERLVKNDYKIIRDCKENPIPKTYLTLVVKNICNDYFRVETGRWRPSTKASELGDLAIRVEELLYRYQYSFSEVMEIIRTEQENCGRPIPSRQCLEEIACLLKVRTKTITFTAEDQHLARLASTDPEHINTLRIKELTPLKAQLDKLIKHLMDNLDEEVRLVFNLYFEHGHKIATISGLTGKSRYQIKQILDDTLHRFKQSILDQGFMQSDINEILEYFI